MVCGNNFKFKIESRVSRVSVVWATCDVSKCDKREEHTGGKRRLDERRYRFIALSTFNIIIIARSSPSNLVML